MAFFWTFHVLGSWIFSTDGRHSVCRIGQGGSRGSENCGWHVTAAGLCRPWWPSPFPRYSWRHAPTGTGHAATVCIGWHSEEFTFQFKMMGRTLLSWHSEEFIFQFKVVGRTLLSWRSEEFIFQFKVTGSLLSWHSEVYFPVQSDWQNSCLDTVKSLLSSSKWLAELFCLDTMKSLLSSSEW